MLFTILNEIITRDSQNCNKAIPSQTVRDRSSSYKIDYVILIKNLLNPKRDQNPISDLKVTAILLKGWILPIGGASAGEGLRLQPVQQACFHLADSEYI